MKVRWQNWLFWYFGQFKFLRFSGRKSVAPYISLVNCWKIYKLQYTLNIWAEHWELHKHMYIPTYTHTIIHTHTGVETDHAVQRLGYGLEVRGIAVRLPAGARGFSLLHNIQAGCGAHPTSYRMGTGGEAAGALTVVELHLHSAICLHGVVLN
jgi:hypothetical protein